MSKELKKSIKEVYLSGKTMQETADIVGCSKGYVQQIIQKSGLRRPFKGYDQKKMTDLERSQRKRLTQKKNNAKAIGYEVDLKWEDIVWPTHCPILGLELNYFADSREENSPSFDRIDNSLGYVKGNVQILSWRANRIKNDGTAEEHKKIYEYLTRSIV